jgi:Na+/proline symporter/signal transduction histidine kinase
MNFNIDIAIFIGFLAVNLFVGLSYGRGVKTIKDYALGGRNFSTAALVSTIVATAISGSGFFTVLSNTYSDGFYYLIPNLTMAFSLIITAYFLVPRMGEFLGSISVADAMGGIYGKEVKLITAVFGILWTIGGIAVQFKVFGNVFNYFLGIDPTYSVFIASSIVILYSSFGGIRAVTYTDIVQFATFGFAIPLIGIMIWNHVYDLNLPFTATLQTAQFDYKEIFSFDNPKFWEMIPLFLYFTIPTTDPACFQRIAMGSNLNQVKRAWVIAAILIVLMKLVTGWIPFLVKVINPNLPVGQIINYVTDTYAFTGLKGLMIIGIAAMAMSTADSRINAAAVLFANDICKTLNIKINELILSKLFSLLLGIFAIYLALTKADLLSMVMTSASLYMSTITVPLLLTIFGFRSGKKTVLISIVAGFSVVIILNIFRVKTDAIIMYSMLANLVFFIASHYLLGQPGGFVGIKDTSYLDNARKERKRKFATITSNIKNFNLIKFCKDNAPKNELTYMGLGIYCIFYTFTTMYSTHIELLRGNGKIILYIYQIMMVTGVIIAMYPIWPMSIKQEVKERIVQLSWNIVIFYMLIFFSGFFVMVSKFGQLQFAVFSINMVIAIVLIGWKLALTMSLIGFYCSVEFYKFYSGIDHIDFSVGSPQFVFMYTLMLIGTAVILFFKPKEERQELADQKVDHLGGRINAQEQQIKEALAIKGEFIRNISHEYHAPMTGISSMAQSLKHAYYHIDDKRRLQAIDDILKNAVRLEVFDSNISSLAKLAKPNYALNLEKVDFTNLLHERIETCRKLYEENNEDRKFLLDIEENIEITSDKYYLSQLLDNLIINAISYCKKGKITITLKQTEGAINFTIADGGIGVLPEELSYIFDEFTVSSKTRTPAGGRGVGLALAKRVIEVHSGVIKAESDGTNGATITFSLPNSP